MANDAYDDYAYQSDGGQVLGVVGKKHRCTVGNGETYKGKQEVGTLYRCPCGRVWFLTRDRHDYERWVHVRGFRLWRLLRQAARTGRSRALTPTSEEDA